MCFRTKGLLTGTKEVYNKYIRQLGKNDPPCPLCHRPFDNADEVGELITEVSYYQYVRAFPVKIISDERPNKIRPFIMRLLCPNPSLFDNSQDKHILASV